MKIEIPGLKNAWLRMARAEDNEALLSIFQNVPMRGNLVLATERGPDFQSLYEMQGATTWCWVIELDGQIEGLGSFLIRDGWMNEQKKRVGYLGDLRVTKKARGILAKVFGQAYAIVREQENCHDFITSVLASNAKALHALTKRSESRKSQPRYDLYRYFDAVQIQFQRRSKKTSKNLEVQIAQEDDLEDLIAFLSDEHRQRPFGYRFDCGEFENRLKNWPGFGLEKTYLVRDGGVLKGLCTAWDAAVVKRYRVLLWRGRMKFLRFVHNLLSKVSRSPSLPKSGDCFRYFYLANLTIKDQDPAVLEALLRSIYNDYRKQSYHFFTLYMEENSPLNRALSTFSVRRLPFQLYSVHQPQEAKRYDNGNTCGFEMALA